MNITFLTFAAADDEALHGAAKAATDDMLILPMSNILLNHTLLLDIPQVYFLRGAAYNLVSALTSLNVTVRSLHSNAHIWTLIDERVSRVLRDGHTAHLLVHVYGTMSAERQYEGVYANCPHAHTHPTSVRFSIS